MASLGAALCILIGQVPFVALYTCHNKLHLIMPRPRQAAHHVGELGRGLLGSPDFFQRLPEASRSFGELWFFSAK